MESGKFVKRKKAEKDRRNIRVTLTEVGQQHLTRPEPDLSVAFQALSQEEQTQLAQLLQKLLQDWQQRYPAERGDRTAHNLTAQMPDDTDSIR